jgi:hypothetical protein
MTSGTPPDVLIGSNHWFYFDQIKNSGDDLHCFLVSICRSEWNGYRTFSTWRTKASESSGLGW